MVKFVCRVCNYVFESKTIPKKCPYCGKEGVVKDPDAQELINES